MASATFRADNDSLMLNRQLNLLSPLPTSITLLVASAVSTDLLLHYAEKDSAGLSFRATRKVYRPTFRMGFILDLRNRSLSDKALPAHNCLFTP